MELVPVENVVEMKSERQHQVSGHRRIIDKHGLIHYVVCIHGRRHDEGDRSNIWPRLLRILLPRNRDFGWAVANRVLRRPAPDFCTESNLASSYRMRNVRLVRPTLPVIRPTRPLLTRRLQGSAPPVRRANAASNPSPASWAGAVIATCDPPECNELSTSQTSSR